MKKLIIFLIMIIIMIVPIIVFSSETSYSKCLNKAENYMDSVTYRNTYKLYLYDGKSSFITHKEYLASMSKSGNSYLFDGVEYWTKTKKDSDYYTVSLNKNSYANVDNANIKTKDTEYILPTSTVTGSGTISNPWIFKEGYKLNIESNNYGSISISNDSSKKTNKITLNMTNDVSKYIYLFPNDKYEYVSNNCNFELKTDENNNDYLYVNKISSSMNCEVVFGKKSYKITLKDYDGDGKQQSVEPNIIYSIENVGYFSNNSATTLLTKLTKTPKRTGYNFKGYKNIDGNIFINEKGEVLQNENELFKSDSEAYIYDEPITYNINYNLNGGTESGTYPESATYDTPFTINNPTRPSFSFVSWTVTSDEGTYTITDNTFLNLRSTEGEVTLTANWKPKNYYVKFNSNGGKGNMDTQTIEYDKSTLLSSNLFTKTGYNLDHWNTKSDGSGTSFSDKSSVKNIANPDETITLYAIWKDNISPTCSVTKTATGSQDGVSVSISCSDNGSGCVSNTITESNLKSSKTFTVYDKSGNSGTCTVNVTSSETVCGTSATQIGHYYTCNSWGHKSSSTCKTWKTRTTTTCQTYGTKEVAPCVGGWGSKCVGYGTKRVCSRYLGRLCVKYTTTTDYSNCTQTFSWCKKWTVVTDYSNCVTYKTEQYCSEYYQIPYCKSYTAKTCSGSKLSYNNYDGFVWTCCATGKSQDGASEYCDYSYSDIKCTVYN